MALYAFACASCGEFDARAAPAELAAVRCPCCRGTPQRRYTVPIVGTGGTPLMRAIGREEKSAHEPDVVRRRVGSSHVPHLHR